MLTIVEMERGSEVERISIGISYYGTVTFSPDTLHKIVNILHSRLQVYKLRMISISCLDW